MTLRGKVLIGPSSFCATDRTPLDRLKEAGWEVILNPYGRKLSKPEVLALLPGVVGLVAGLEPLTRDVLERSKLKAISRCGVGMSNVDLQAAQEMGIAVRSTPDGPTTAVAELTVGIMLCLMRRVTVMDRDLHEAQWNKQIGFQLEGKTVLIIGFGRIGRKVSRLLRPFGVTVLAVDPALHGTHEGVRVLPRPEALPLADVISVHASGEDEILGAAEFASMKQGTFILNAARGGLVSERHLCLALENGRVAGAWLDTFQDEPYTGPLTKFPQVVLTPHAGSFSLECRQRMEREAVENLLDALDGVAEMR